MDFGGSMGEQFERWFEEGRRSVGTPAAAAIEPALPASVTPEPAPLPSLGSEQKPVCTEPWKSLYILRRGVFPCCYGGAPVAPMDGYREAWNAPLVQAVRAELAQGRFHDYCLRSPACPIVRKAQQAQELPATQAATLRARELRTEVDRLTGGSAGRVYRAGKRVFRAITGQFRS
jgi:hypothetical protein